MRISLKPSSKLTIARSENATVRTTARLGWEHDCRTIPVTGDEGQLIGLVNDLDAWVASLPGLSPGESQLLINSVVAVRSYAIRKHGNDTILLVLLGELEAECRILLSGSAAGR